MTILSNKMEANCTPNRKKNISANKSYSRVLNLHSTHYFLLKNIKDTFYLTYCVLLLYFDLFGELFSKLRLWQRQPFSLHQLQLRYIKYSLSRSSREVAVMSSFVPFFRFVTLISATISCSFSDSGSVSVLLQSLLCSSVAMFLLCLGPYHLSKELHSVN